MDGIGLAAVIVGALSRRLVGWGRAPRLLGQALAGFAALGLTWHLGPWPAILCAAATPLAYGLPWHGETMNKPVLMSLRNGAYTLVLSGGLWVLVGERALWYAPCGLLAGVVYWAAKKWAPKGPEGGFYDGHVSAAELGLGAVLVGGLALI